MLDRPVTLCETWRKHLPRSGDANNYLFSNSALLEAVQLQLRLQWRCHHSTWEVYAVPCIAGHCFCWLQRASHRLLVSTRKNFAKHELDGLLNRLHQRLVLVFRWKGLAMQHSMHALSCIPPEGNGVSLCAACCCKLCGNRGLTESNLFFHCRHWQVDTQGVLSTSGLLSCASLRSASNVLEANRCILRSAWLKASGARA